MTTNGLSLGRTLHALRRSLLTHAPEQAVAILQETGYASGADVYRAFGEWLRAHRGIEGPEQLDAAYLNDALADFFQAAGWGTLAVSPLPGAALAVDSPDWAEAEPGTAEVPMCFFSAGLLADFLGRLAGEAVAVMEVECRSRNDGRCRFLSATPETLQQVYEAMVAGRSYLDALRP
ncbi:MAG TPA: V4R domain-containing protein [Gemmatimonadales bacterium]|nr:V4R domain-containing protein [Gemmatimonadales bacterium]